MSASGRRFTQAMARDLSHSPRLALICGHYEGIDERVHQILGADEVSIGDFVLTGGEIAAMAIADATVRLVPGVIDADSIIDESHEAGRELLEYPHYTRPASYRGLDVPEILRSGDHGRIREWREEQAHLRTARLRPDLLPPGNESSR
jgi:tRNA (guanine37-N1)-methyltransferase